MTTDCLNFKNFVDYNFNLEQLATGQHRQDDKTDGRQKKTKEESSQNDKYRAVARCSLSA